MKKGPDFCSQAPLVGIPPSSAYEKTALCLTRAVISVGWQSIFGCFIVYPFVHRRKAVICTHISNVTGYILPIAQIFEEAKKYGAITVLDTAQSLGLVPVDIRTIRADIIAFAGHKTLYGPFGIGGFLNTTGVSLEETIVGGTGSDSLNLNMPAGAEARYESSSTNINAIAGLNAALEVLNQPLLLEKEKELSNYLKKELEELSNIKIYLPKEEQDHVGIFSITVDEYLADDVGTILDEEFDLAVRTGYHCAPWIHEYLGDIQMKEQ